MIRVPSHNLERTQTWGIWSNIQAHVEEGYVQVRGFIKDTEDTIQELNQLTGETNG